MFVCVCVCVIAGESVGSMWRRLATFMPAYGPWVWDKEGAGIRARLVLVGGGDVCVCVCVCVCVGL